MKQHRVLLLGAGAMSKDYAKVLQDLRVETTVVGRGKASAQAFMKATGMKVLSGGIEKFLAGKPELPREAIVSVGVEALKDAALALLRAGVRRLLLEKPGGIDSAELEAIRREASARRAEVVLAYNRRFFAAVAKARKIIAADGGVSSFHFEFTEWSHVIGTLAKPKPVMESWLLANSSHVIDLAFFLGGEPKKICCFHSGRLRWHSAASAFSGAGISKTGALFSYQADWAAPGRWGVEVMTAKNRLIFKPMEKLQIQKIGSVAVEPAALDDRLDTEFKPGLHRQVELFLRGETKDFCGIKEQCRMARIYEQMAGYAREG